MIGDEFVAGTIPRVEVRVYQHPIGEGLSQYLTEMRDDLCTYSYTSFVDVMQPTATPQLVIIETGPSGRPWMVGETE